MKLFYLQWHITAKCHNNCLHCYIVKDDRLKTILTFEKAKQIVNDFVNFCNKWKFKKRLVITGGDPLLCSYFWELIAYVKDKDKKVEINIVGNPELLNEEVIERLEENNVFCYQLSVDGLEKTHDFYRYSGSFQETLKKIKMLANSKILPISLSSISFLNMNEMPELVKILFDYGIKRWDFARCVKTSENKPLPLISPLVYKNFLLKMKEIYENLNLAPEVIGHKEPLWVLIDSPDNLENQKEKFYGGCGIGAGSLTILHDGTVMACRRHLGSIIGKVPEQSIEDIFFFSEKMNFLRKVKNIRKCGECKFIWHCRGCRAVAFGETNDYYAPDPQCWYLK